ncbi:hypothetical protein WJX72_010532 [[Myrmecia] bisecta]|uniref:Poly [ADP-ribose] polymerase n=1 Tax=[Myrmecia] bisecta TaxID=41462 RepID=A0AAW1PUB9_9CHLO
MSDLHLVDTNTAEFKQIAQLAFHPVRQIKRVDVPARKAKFQSYVNSLVSSVTVRVCHGTPAVANANNIARHGPDFARTGSHVGSAFGQGFYTATDVETPAGYATASGAEQCVNLLRDVDLQNAGIMEHLFRMEAQQFTQGLPMYARKGEFLTKLHGARGVVLKGGAV